MNRNAGRQAAGGTDAEAGAPAVGACGGKVNYLRLCGRKGV